MEHTLCCVKSWKRLSHIWITWLDIIVTQKCAYERKVQNTRPDMDASRQSHVFFAITIMYDPWFACLQYSGKNYEDEIQAQFFFGSIEWENLTPDLHFDRVSFLTFGAFGKFTPISQGIFTFWLNYLSRDKKSEKSGSEGFKIKRRTKMHVEIEVDFFLDKRYILKISTLPRNFNNT